MLDLDDARTSRSHGVDGSQQVVSLGGMGQWKTLFGSSTDESFPCSNIDKP